MSQVANPNWPHADPTSKRQVNKAKRAASAKSSDKWGFSKSLSRKQRRAQRRLFWGQHYGSGAGSSIYKVDYTGQGRNQLGGGMQKTNQFVYAAGAMRCQ